MPPYEEIAYQAAEACGRLPLVLAVAGGILAEAGGGLDEEFVKLLQEDQGEVLRHGDFGDEHVKIEDRLITEITLHEILSRHAQALNGHDSG